MIKNNVKIADKEVELVDPCFDLEMLV